MLLSNNRKFNDSIDNFIHSAFDNGYQNSILILTPSIRLKRKLQKEFVRFNKPGSLNSIKIETVRTLAQKLLREIKPEISILPEAAHAVVLLQAVSKAMENKLKYYPVFKDSDGFADIQPGILKELQTGISKMKELGIDYSQLIQKAGELTGYDKSKTEDIANIYNYFDHELNNLNLCEIGDIYLQLIKFDSKLIQSTFSNLYPEIKYLFVRGYSHFFPPEVEIIKKLSFISIIEQSDLTTVFEIEYNSKNTGLFGYIRENVIERLKIAGFFEINVDQLEEETLSSYLRSNLFNRKSKAHLPHKFSNLNVCVKTGINKRNEVMVIGKEIKQLLKDPKVKPSDICVVFNLISEYAPYVRDVFDEYNIPYNLTDRIKVNRFNPVNAVVYILELVVSNFYHANIVKTCSNPVVSQIVDSDSLLDSFIFTATDLKLNRGLSSMKSKIERRIEFISKNNKGTTSSKITAYRNALELIKNLEELIKGFEEKLTITNFIREFDNLLRKLNLTGFILSNSMPDIEKEKNLRAISLFRNSSVEIFSALGKYLYTAESSFNVSFYLNRLNLIASEARFNLHEKPESGVLVTNPDEVRGLSFDYLFIGGLNEEVFPTNSKPEVFISTDLKESFKNSLYKQKFSFYETIRSWNYFKSSQTGLFLSYATNQGESNLMESFFLDELKKVQNVSQESGANSGAISICSTRELNANLNFVDADELYKLTAFNKYALEIMSLNDKERIEQTNPGDTVITSEFAGVFSSDAEKKIPGLVEFFNNRVSVTAFESYAKCPFKFYTEKVLKYKVIDTPSDEIENYEIGNFMHSVLESFYKSDLIKGKSISQLNRLEFNNAVDLLFNIALEKLPDFNFFDENSKLENLEPVIFWDFEKIFGVNGNREDSVLFNFLLYEKNKGSNFAPHAFETQGLLELKLNGESPGKVLLHGKIDRIDINQEGGTFKIYDYKLTGKKVSKEDQIEGTHLQLPLYMLIAKENILSDSPHEPAYPCIYSLKFREDELREVDVIFLNEKKLDESTSSNNWIEHAKNKVAEFTENISVGKFHISKINNREMRACQYCNLTPVCRIQEASPGF
ncbi:MAG: exodeoxyribonuclease V subunit gamma [Ignavibacteriaceae bacterium]|nr:exodeoxyribonuclease V subunit gamma [Ignavibacteriaceae bacterium]